MSPEPISPRHLALGLAIRGLREEQGMSQKAFAGQTGLHPTYISGVERGVRNPSWSVILEIADALKVRPSKIVEMADRTRL